MIPPLRNTALKYAYTRNAYGDFVLTTTTTLPCHFRYITEQVVSTSEAIQSDAMAWFEPDSGVAKNDVLVIENETFKVERIIHARKLRDPEVQFIKTYLTRYGLIS